MNAIQWALEMLGLMDPQDRPPEYPERMEELHFLSRNGVADHAAQCPSAGCGYAINLPPGMTFDAPPVCPYHGAALMPVTWKHMALRFKAMLEAQTVAYNGEINFASQEVKEAREKLDDLQFFAATAEEECYRLRSIEEGPIGRLAVLMDRELQANAHKGDWQGWKPDREELIGEIQHHLDKFQDALEKKHRACVAEFAADIANYMTKAVELYGPKS